MIFNTSCNNSYSAMPANQPTANSLSANALGEFAGTAYSQPLGTSRKKIKTMNWEELPINEIRRELRIEENPKKAFHNIINFGRQKLQSNIWNEFENMNIERDIQDIQFWLKPNLYEFPDFSGIYFGLDTLNMEGGNGTNLEIGLSNSCDPKIFNDEWAFQCEKYGESHLIKGLFEVSDCFDNGEKWSNDERNFTEYIIFLSYSGVILREALNNIKIENDYISLWGFHDGDMFFLTQKINGINSIVTEIDL